MNFDMDERLISEALGSLETEVTTPDLMKGINEKMEILKKTRKVMRRVITSGLIAAILAATAFAASFGGLDWLREKTDVPFGDVVEESFRIAASNGINISVIAEKSYGDRAVVYLTVEDTQGLGRVDERSGLSLSTGKGFFCRSSKQIYFDKESGVAAFELYFEKNGEALAETPQFTVSALSYAGEEIGEVELDINLAELEFIGEPFATPDRAPDYELPIGRLAEVYGVEDAWISAAGVLNGNLTIQTVQAIPPGVKYMTSSLRPYLRDGDGNIVKSWGGFGTLANENLERWEAPERKAYFVHQAYFRVDTDNLADYTLCCEGRQLKWQNGSWVFSLSFEGGSGIVETAADISVNGVQVSGAKITLHPLGMTLEGSGGLNDDYVEVIKAEVVLETAEGEIKFTENGASPLGEGRFRCEWYARYAIDVKNVSAIRIGDNRIELAK